MALTVYLRPQDASQVLRFEGTDTVTFKIPENTGQFVMGFTCFIVASDVDIVTVTPDTGNVLLAAYTPSINNPNDIGVLTNLDGLNNWRFNVNSPNTTSSINEELLTGTKTLGNSDPTWQALDPNGADRIVNITGTTTALEYLIINDGTVNNLLIKELGTLVDTLLPGESSLYKRLSSKWVALRFTNYV